MYFFFSHSTGTVYFYIKEVGTGTGFKKTFLEILLIDTGMVPIFSIWLDIRPHIQSSSVSGLPVHPNWKMPQSQS
jgi:hypothetical protein